MFTNRTRKRDNTTQPDRIRRRLLGYMTAATALLATGRSANMFAAVADQRSYAAASVLFELDGALAGSPLAATGGDRFFDLSLAPGRQFPNKVIGAQHVIPLELTVNAGMSAAFYDWINAFLDGSFQTRNAALVQVNYQGAPSSRIGFRSATIIGVTLSPLDANSQDLASIVVTIAAESSSIEPATVSPNVVQGPRNTTRWLANRFSLAIRDIEAASKGVLRIDGIGAKSSPAMKGLDVSNIRLTLPNTYATPFYQWFDQSAKGEPVERPGVLSLMSATSPTPIGSVELINLGVVRVGNGKWSSSSDASPLVSVDLYCEQLRFKMTGMAS